MAGTAKDCTSVADLENEDILKEVNEEFSITVGNAIQASFTLKLLEKQESYVQIDVLPRYESGVVTGNSATYAQLDTKRNVVPVSIKDKTWVGISDDQHSWRRDDEAWTFNAFFRAFRHKDTTYVARLHYLQDHDLPVDPNKDE